MPQISPSHLHAAHQHCGTETMHATWEWQRLIPTAMLPRTRIYFQHPCTTSRNLSQVKGGWSFRWKQPWGWKQKLRCVVFRFFCRVMLGWDSLRKGMMKWFFEMVQNWNHDQKIIKWEKTTTTQMIVKPAFLHHINTNHKPFSQSTITIKPTIPTIPVEYTKSKIPVITKS